MPGEAYKNDHAKAGIALIIVGENFEDARLRRPGAIQDKEYLRKTLEQMGFDVRILKDGSTSKILKTARKVAKEDHSEHDCLVVAVSSHGDTMERPSREDHGLNNFEFVDKMDLLSGTDGPFAFHELTECFNEEKAPTLKDKPKIFFIQGCRGHAFAETVTINLPPTRQPSIRGDDKMAARSPSSLDAIDGVEPCQDDFDLLDGGTRRPRSPVSPSHFHTQDGRPLKQRLPNGETKLPPSSNGNLGKVGSIIPVISISSLEDVGNDVTGDPPIGESEKNAVRRESMDKCTESQARNDKEAVRESGALEDREGILTPPSTACEQAGTTVQGSEPLLPKERIVNHKSAIFKDVLSIWAAPPGYFAFHSKKGSPFIRILCEVLSAHHKKDDLLTMLTEVNRRVATEYESTFKDPYKNKRKIVPCMEHQLRKQVLLRGKVKSDQIPTVIVTDAETAAVGRN